MTVKELIESLKRLIDEGVSPDEIVLKSSDNEGNSFIRVTLVEEGSCTEMRYYYEVGDRDSKETPCVVIW